MQSSPGLGVTRSLARALWVGGGTGCADLGSGEVSGCKVSALGPPCGASIVWAAGIAPAAGQLESFCRLEGPFQSGWRSCSSKPPRNLEPPLEVFFQWEVY